MEHHLVWIQLVWTSGEWRIVYTPAGYPRHFASLPTERRHCITPFLKRFSSQTKLKKNIHNPGLIESLFPKYSDFKVCSTKEKSSHPLTTRFHLGWDVRSLVSVAQQFSNSTDTWGLVDTNSTSKWIGSWRYFGIG